MASERKLYLRSAAVALLFFAAGCTQLLGPSESAQVQRLAGQGFKLIADGRGSAAPSAMTYSGDPQSVIACRRSGSRSAAITQTATFESENGLRGRQRGHVDAYVQISNSGQLSGVYLNYILREIRTSSGQLAGREFERIRFKPTGSASFDDGLTCRPRR